MQEGVDCDHGAQYILQVNTVVQSGAKIACLEHVGSTALLNGGRAVEILRRFWQGWLGNTPHGAARTALWGVN